MVLVSINLNLYYDNYQWKFSNIIEIKALQILIKYTWLIISILSPFWVIGLTLLIVLNLFTEQNQNHDTPNDQQK